MFGRRLCFDNALSRYPQDKGFDNTYELAGTRFYGPRAVPLVQTLSTEHRSLIALDLRHLLQSHSCICNVAHTIHKRVRHEV